jgi:beta-glucanase (GH16 family)
VNKGGQTISTASTAFHVYTLDWFEDKMVFKVDGVEHYTYEPSVRNSSTWPFEDDQYILINVAILPSIIGTGFTESAMEIDYVRVYQESALSISDLNKNDIKLFPNPVADTLNIDLPIDLKGSKAMIYTIGGQEVTSFIQKETSFNLDVSTYTTGIYFIRFQKDGKVTTFKILKK